MCIYIYVYNENTVLGVIALTFSFKATQERLNSEAKSLMVLLLDSKSTLSASVGQY